MTTPGAPADPGGAPDPIALLRTRSYVVLLVFGAVLGAPIAAISYLFLKVTTESETWVFATLPKDLGFSSVPVWWPLPMLMLCGLIVAVAIKYLPGTGGHVPADGLKMGTPADNELPGIIIAAVASLALGAVVGPEAPLIALGGGLAALTVHLIRKDAPAQAVTVIGAAGAFAAVSTLLGSPLVGAFLIMEAAGLGGALLGVVLVPGLLAAGIGTLVFVGIDSWTGWGTQALAVPNLPPFDKIEGTEFLWAIGIGLLAAVCGTAIRRGAQWLVPRVAVRRVLYTVLAGAAIALLAILFGEITTHGADQVLFSGETALPGLLQNADTWSVGALLALIACKGIAYLLSLSSFRGGPTFPAMFLGAAGGMVLSHVGGLPMIAGAAMGIGAMTAVLLGLPFTAVLVTEVFLQADALKLTPLIIVAVVVAYVASAWLAPAAKPTAEPATGQPDAPPTA
jgi:H+/Cl- antiporter ClcA